jgi:SAM-dependent methyltransferase
MTTDAPPAPAKPHAEFDAYAPDYAAGMENPLKAALGGSAEQYIAPKLRWLLRRCPSLRTAEAPMRVLDYGCGTATLLRLMAEAGVTASLAGSDVSEGMLAEAERRWPEHLRGACPDLRAQRGERTPFPDGSFDLVVISAVLHHVPPEKRPEVYAELCRVARPGGQIVVFEHNPLNPVTRYVVARTPIDRDAVLLHAREAERGLAATGATDLRTRYIMFAPPRLRALAPLEEAFGWLPLGAQYAVIAVVGPQPV